MKKAVIVGILILALGLVVSGISFALMGFSFNSFAKEKYESVTTEIGTEFTAIDIRGNTENIRLCRIDQNFPETRTPRVVCSENSWLKHTAKVKIVPLQFLKAVLPNPQDLGENYDGETSIGCRIKGIKDGKERTYYVYNNCSHQAAYKETGMQGVSYTTGVPAMIGAMMFFKGLWRKPGVWNVEEFDPDPFMEQLNKQGLPWVEVFDGDLEL